MPGDVQVVEWKKAYVLHNEIKQHFLYKSWMGLDSRHCTMLECLSWDANHVKEKDCVNYLVVLLYFHTIFISCVIWYSSRRIKNQNENGSHKLCCEKVNLQSCHFSVVG